MHIEYMTQKMHLSGLKRCIKHVGKTLLCHLKAINTYCDKPKVLKKFLKSISFDLSSVTYHCDGKRRKSETTRTYIYVSNETMYDQFTSPFSFTIKSLNAYQYHIYERVEKLESLQGYIIT